MGTAPPASDEIRVIADHIFGLLRGDEHPRIPTVGDHAYQHIWLQLVTGSRQPGTHLSDIEIANTLGVSRTPVREALRRLVQEELVRADPRRGFWVQEPTARDIEEFYDIRAVLESLALQQGARNILSDDLEAQLAEIDALRHPALAQPILEFLKHDFRFHNAIINASNNRRLIRMLATLRAQVSIFQIRDTGFALRIEHALDGHERVVRALITERFDDAAHLLSGHIAESRDAVLSDIFGETTDLHLPTRTHPSTIRGPAQPPGQPAHVVTAIPARRIPDGSEIYR